MIVSALACHPLKSGRPVDLRRAQVDRWGVRGDRRWMLVDADGFVTARADPALLQVGVWADDASARFSAPGRGEVVVPVPHDGEHVVTPVWGDDARGLVADDGGWFTALLGRPVRLVWCDDPTFRAVDQEHAQPGDTVAFADGFPLLLTSATSLAALQGWVEESCAARGEDAPALQMARFRPNLVADGAPAWAEQSWRRLRVGALTFRVAKPCGRCVMPNVDLDTLAVGKEPLRTLAARNRYDGRSVFGMNLVPDAAGEVAVGDEVVVLD